MWWRVLVGLKPRTSNSVVPPWPRRAAAGHPVKVWSSGDIPPYPRRGLYGPDGKALVYA